MRGQAPLGQQQQKRNTPNSTASASTRTVTLQDLRNLNQNQIQKLPVSVREQVKALRNLSLNSDGEVRPEDPVSGAVFDYIRAHRLCSRSSGGGGKVYFYGSDRKTAIQIAPNKEAYVAGCAMIQIGNSGNPTGNIFYETMILFEPTRKGANILLALGSDVGLKEITPLQSITRGHYDLKTNSYGWGCIWGSCDSSSWNYKLAKWNGNQYDLGVVGSGKNRH